MSSSVSPYLDFINSSQRPCSSRFPRHRNRTLSLSSVSSTQSRITLGLVNADAALATLHALAHTAQGSFTPTASARAALQYLLHSRKSIPRSCNSKHRNRLMSVWSDDDDSLLSSGLPSLTISTSHTVSPSFGLSPASTSSSTFIDGYQQGHQRITSQSGDFHPTLAKLERKSKLLSQKVLCSTCSKQGSDYPKCGSCAATWCSRECRLAGGRKHICSQHVVN